MTNHLGVPGHSDGGPQRESAGNVQAHALGGPLDLAVAAVGDVQPQQLQMCARCHMDRIYQCPKIQHR